LSHLLWLIYRRKYSAAVEDKVSRRKSTHKEDFDRVRSIGRKYAFALRGNSKKSAPAFVALKNEPYAVAEYVLRHISDSPTAILTVIGNTFPRNISDVSRDLPFPYDDRLEVELRWSQVVLSRFADRLNIFVHLSQQFLNQILCGRYDDARATIQKIQSQFGWSMWLIQANAVLTFLIDGAGQHHSFITSAKESIDDYHVQFRLDCIDSRIGLSASDFAHQLDWLRDALPKNRTDIRTYFGLHLGRLDWIDSSQLTAFIWHNQRYSLVDRYLYYIKILKYIVLGRNPIVSITSMRQLIDRGCRTFADHRFINMRQLLSSSEPIERDTATDQLLEVADTYTRGDYASAFSRSAQLLQESPGCFELYEFYAASLLHNGDEYKAIGIESCPLNVISESVYNILVKNERAEEGLALIAKFAGMLEGTSFSGQLEAFNKHHTGPITAPSHNIPDAVSASGFTPRFSLTYGDPSIGRRFLTQLEKLNPDNSATKLFSQYCENSSAHNTAPIDFNAPECRVLAYNAKLFEHRKQPIEAIQYHQQLLELFGEFPIVHTESTIGLYNCYLLANRITDAIHLVIDTYFEYKPILMAFDLPGLISRIGTLDNYQGQADLELAILYYIYYDQQRLPKNTRALFVAYDLFLKAEKVFRPTELFNNTSRFAQQKLFFFLRNICVPEVMDWSYKFKGSADLEGERIAVCQFLREHDSVNSTTYSEEISRITLNALIREAIYQADTSKVFVDTAGIARSLDKGFRDIFERFTVMSRLTNDQVRQLSTVLERIYGDHLVAVNLSSGALSLFRTIFEEVRTRFISGNEYGLDAYLSVRIRHGAFSGEVRGLFESFNLITRRSEGIYLRND
jgi:hypothetical protein